MYRAPERIATLEPPLRMCFNYIKENTRIRVHLHQNSKMYMEGTMVGFDEFMNLVLDDAYEIYPKSGTKIALGTTLLKGESVGIMHPVPE